MLERSKANIVLFGRSGAGKSSFINYILGNEVAPTGCGEPVTTSFDEYEYTLRNGIAIRIFDSKGLEVVGYKETVKEIIDYISKRNSSKDILEWMHSFFYCINIDRARLEPEEIRFINKISETAGVPIHIIITHCRGASNVDNEQAMQERIRSTLGQHVKVYCINSVEKHYFTGEVVHQFGKELVILGLLDLLWENTAKKIATNYAQQMRSGLLKVIEDFKRENIRNIENTQISELEKGLIHGTLEESSDSIMRFMNEMNASYNDCINSFLNMYCLLTNALVGKYITHFSPYALSYYVLLDDALKDELTNWHKKRVVEISRKSEIELFLESIDPTKNIRETFKEPVIYLSQKMRERIPSQETIEKEIYDMLLKAKEDNIHHSPSVRIIKKIGVNDPCPCGSGRKYKKCCMGKGIFD